MKKFIYIEVIDSDTNEVVKRVDMNDKTLRQIDKIEDGMNINLDHDKYYTRQEHSETILNVI